MFLPAAAVVPGFRLGRRCRAVVLSSLRGRRVGLRAGQAVEAVGWLVAQLMLLLLRRRVRRMLAVLELHLECSGGLVRRPEHSGAVGLSIAGVVQVSEVSAAVSVTSMVVGQRL